MDTLQITISEEEYERVMETQSCKELYRSACSCQRSKFVDADGRPLKYRLIEMKTKNSKILTRSFRSITIRFFAHYPNEPNKKHYVISYY